MFYVAISLQDQPTEHETYEEAREELVQLEAKGFKPQIFGPGLGYDWSTLEKQQ